MKELTLQEIDARIEELLFDGASRRTHITVAENREGVALIHELNARWASRTAPPTIEERLSDARAATRRARLQPEADVHAPSTTKPFKHPPVTSAEFPLVREYFEEFLLALKVFGSAFEREHWESLLDELLSRHAMDLRCSACESPIEAQMLRGLATHAREYVFTPQLAFGDYRIDIAEEKLKIAIECDGHAFHEKTKEQVSRSHKRDIELQLAGWLVLHFSGSEIYNNTGSCIETVRRACAVRMAVA